MLFRCVGLNWSKALGIALASTVGFYANSSVAQITPDGTLPTNSNVTSEGNTRTITGGTQAGGNLFHSFTEFSVPTGSEAFFNNGADIQNIINRVTGGSISDIDGLIRANGGANLFLINPNGIVFGPNARLNIGGSFYGTSANSMRFSDGSEFSAVNPQSPPLLTINVPLGLQFGNNPGNITVGNDQTEPTADSPTLLEVPTGETLALVGGDVNVNGERLRASGGRIELGGLASEGTVGINNDGSLTFPEGVARADVSLNGSELDVTGGGGGSIGINAGNINLLGGSDLCAGIGGDPACGGLASDTPGSVGSQAGDITLNATRDITGSGGVLINNRVNTGATGNSGNINIEARSLSMTDGAQISASTRGQGNAGSVTINANDLLRFDGEGQDGNPSGAFSRVNSGAVGNGGGVSITTGSLEVINGAQLSSSSFGSGNAGDVEIDAKSIRLDNDGTIATNTQSTDGNPQANINIRSRSLILRRGSNITANATGENVIGGNITINTGVLAGYEDSNITANSTDARGGNIQINAEGVFNMQFREEDSPLTSDITATGANNQLSGNVEIDTTEADPTRGLGEVPADTVDASTQISDPCVPGGGGFANSFVSIGRGGLPITPREPLQDTSTISTWVRLKPQRPSRTNKKRKSRTTSPQPTTAAKTPKVEQPTQIVEATGWIVNAQGNIEFVAQANHSNPKSPSQNPASCSAGN